MPDYSRRQQQLTQRLTELDGRLHRIDDHLHQTPNPDVEDRAQESEMDEVLEGLGAAGAAEVNAIHAALARIEGGTFGICLRCGSDIAEKRLDIIPQATLCQTCAAGAEGKR